VSGKTLFALLVLVLVVLAPFTVLPALLESVTARLLQDQLGLQETPEVEIESSPAPMMYAGSFSKALVSVKGIELGGVKTENVAMEFDPFDLNLLESVTSGAVSTEQPLSGKLSVALSEASALSLAQAGSAVPVQDIEFEKDQVVLKLELGFGSPTSVRGRLFLQDQLLIFEPQQVDESPGLVTAEQVLAVTGFAYPTSGLPFAVSGLPFGVEVSGVEVRKDRVTLSGQIQSIPLGVPVG
jgi:LmeA-like phospholipid-binding